MTSAELERVFSGDESALSRFVDAVTPVIQARVTRTLLRRGELAKVDVRPQVEDLTQEIFLVLFNDQARVLRDWDPERGLSLLNFVGFVTERQVASILRTGKRNPWKEDPTLTEELDGQDSAAGPEDQAASRDVLRRLLSRLEEQLSPLGRQLFDLLYLRERSVGEVQSDTGLSPDAIYAWRSRLRRLAHRARRELEG